MCRAVKKNRAILPLHQTEADIRGQEVLQDRALIEATLMNSNAYAAVIRCYEIVLRRYIRRILGHHSQAADDVLQEVFIKAYVNLRDYDMQRPFGPWIYRIAHNEAVNFLRKRRTEPLQVDGETASLILERLIDGFDVSEEFEKKCDAEIIQNAMGSLDRRYHEALVLRFLEDKSYGEISEILEIPAGTVATHINRGLKQLKKCLTTSSGARQI